MKQYVCFENLGTLRVLIVLTWTQKTWLRPLRLPPFSISESLPHSNSDYLAEHTLMLWTRLLTIV
jgi:hypothetical protein